MILDIQIHPNQDNCPLPTGWSQIQKVRRFTLFTFQDYTAKPEIVFHEESGKQTNINLSAIRMLRITND